jgi:polysaccharide biosynthesis/export protein
MQALKTVLQVVIVLMAALLLAGCPGGRALKDSDAGNGTFVESGPAQSTGGVGGTAAANAQKIFAANSSEANGNNEDYKIAPLDVLDITVFGVAELNRTVQVSTNGQITLPLVKSVRAGGRTQAQLEKEIAAKLEATYLQSPQVSVFVKEYNSQRITVDGAVNKPGIFPTTGKISLLQAIALAEGLNAVADPSGVLLFRIVDKKRLAARFDLKQIRSGKVNDPGLQAGDVVMVDESTTRTTLRDIKEALPLTGLFQLLLL